CERVRTQGTRYHPRRRSPLQRRHTRPNDGSGHLLAQGASQLMTPRGGSGIDLLGLGMSVLDSIHLIDDFPHGAGVSRVLGSSLMGGGPVPTALCAASRLGAEATILDRIGDDWRGERIRADYEKFG